MSRVDTKSAQLFVPTPRGHAFWQVDVNERSVLGCFEKEGCVEAAGCYLNEIIFLKIKQ